jgi:RNA polymerase sigma factor (sigma-70 family)
MSKQQAEIVLQHIRRLASTSPIGPEHDRQLLERFAQRREEAAFAALLDRYGAMVLRVCRRILHDAHEAEDAFQATFLILARKAGAIRRQQSLGSWLYRVASHVATRARADAARREDLAARVACRPTVDPLAEVSGRELLQVLDDELQRLPEKYRMPLLLCYLEGHTQDEAARQLGWSPQVLRGRVERGRAVLRRRLLRRGFGLSAVLVGGLLEQTSAPAAVPGMLIAQTLRVVMGSPGGSAMAVSAHVAALAESGINTLGASKLKFVVSLVLMLGVLAAGLGAGLSSLRAPKPETPAAASPAAPPARAKNEPRRDRYGDPLPPGAVARLGTLRFRAPGEIKTLAFAPDGKTIAVSSPVGLFLFDAASGKRIKRLLAPDSRRDWEYPIIFSPDSKRLAGKGRTTVAENRFKDVAFVWELAGQRKPREYDGENVVWVGWSADGELLAVYQETGALRLHELATGRSRCFECKEPSSGGFAPAARTLVAVEGQGLVRVWDTDTGRERCTFRTKDASTRPLVLSPDGRILAFRGGENVQLWDATTGKALHTVAMDQKFLCSAVFAPDGKTLATAGLSGVRFWDVATGRERNRIQGAGSDTERAVAFAPDCLTLATGERHDGAIHLWDVATGKQKPNLVGHRSMPYGTFSPDGRRLATGGGLDGTIFIWDLATAESLVRIQRPKKSVRDMAFSPNGRSLFSTWTDENLWVSDADSGERRHVLKIEDPDRPDTHQSAISMQLSADGKTLLTFSYYYPRKSDAGPDPKDTLIAGWDTSTHKQLFRRRRPGMDWTVLSADSRILAAAHRGGSPLEGKDAPGKGPMRLENVATGENLLTFPVLHGQTRPEAFSPDGRLLAANNFDSLPRGGRPGEYANTLRLWEVATAAEVLVLPTTANPRVTFAPDGHLLAATTPPGEILLWDLMRGNERCRFKGFDAEVTSLLFSPDGRRLVSGLSDSTLLIWDVGTHETALAGKLGTERLAKAWADLAGADAPRAFRARGLLAAAPEETVLFLKEHLHPAQSADAEHLRHLLTDLASDEFTGREKARKALEELGDLAEPALRQMLANKPTLEVRRRVQALLQRLRGPETRPEMLRSLRVVAALEDIGTPPARRLLGELAKGASEARLTRESKASLDRLTRRSAP